MLMRTEWYSWIHCNEDLELNGTYGFSASHDTEHILEHIYTTIDCLIVSLTYSARAQLHYRYL